MAYQALYRKWRPLSFDDVVGQGHIVATLKNEISSGKAAHAYLFCGTRGTGKTSCAKIFARAINCLNPKDGNPCNECEICRGALDGSMLDITEIDAASNNGVDNIREIRDEVSYSAAQAKYKIYIIDEVHMLSGGAFNALLKTLEEPPAHVIFILATTEAHKLPATITSRCQRFDFRRISVRDIVLRIREIVTAENIDADSDAIELIARLADGAMRDALSILDRCVGACDGRITLEAARNVLSITADEAVDELAEAIYDKNAAEVIRIFSEIVQSGKDINSFIETLIRRFRDILVCKVSGAEDGLFDCSQDTLDSIRKNAKRFGGAELSYITEVLCGALADAKWQKNARVLYELTLMRLCDSRLDTSNAAILARIEALEAAISGGNARQPVSKANAERKAEESKPIAAEKDAEATEDCPPWDLPEEQALPQKTPEPKHKEASAKKEESKPPVEVKRMKEGTPAAANVWGELLGVLKKKYPPLYGALFMKKAKYAGGALCLVNEAYIKEIVSMFRSDFEVALWSVVPNARINFVTESELEMLTEDAVQTAEAGNETDAAQSSEASVPDKSDDPLDALLSMENADIVIEE